MRRAATRAAIIGLLSGGLALGSACEADPGDAASDRFEIVDSAGVALVLNGDVGPWGPNPLSVRETLRIGVVEGEDPYQLARVMDVAVAGDGRIYLSRGRPYQVDVFSPQGDLIRSVRRAHPAVPLGPEDVEEHLALAREYLLGDDHPGRREMGPGELDFYERRVRAQAGFPMADHRAPLRRLLVGRAGSFWVERVDHRSPALLELEATFTEPFRDRIAEGPNLWDLFDPEGRFLGQVELPPPSTPTTWTAAP